MNFIDRNNSVKKSFNSNNFNAPRGNQPRKQVGFQNARNTSTPRRNVSPIHSNSSLRLNNSSVQKRSVKKPINNQSRNITRNQKPILDRSRVEQNNFKNPIPKREELKLEKSEPQKSSVVLLDRLVMFSIFMLFTGLPLFFLKLTYQGINFEKQYYFYFWTFVGLVAWGAKSIIMGSLTIRRTPLDFSLLAFLIIYFVASLTSIDRYHSFFGFFSSPVQGFVSVLIMILAYYLIIMNVNHDRAKFLLKTNVVVGSLISVWFFLGSLEILSISVFDKIPLNPIGVSFSSLVVYFGLLIVSILTLLAKFDDKGEEDLTEAVISTVLLIVLGITIFNISTLFNYVRWIPLLISISILLVFTLSRVVKFSQRMIYISVGIFLLLVTLLIIGKPIIESKILPAEASINFNSSLKIATEAVKNKPILGSGPGTYGYNSSLFIGELGGVRFYSGRGIIFESLATVGFLGFVSMIVVILTYVGATVHMLNKYGDKSKIMSLGFFVATIVILAGAVTWNLDGGLIILGTLMAALSVIVAQDETDSQGITKTFSLKTSPQHALMHSFLFLVVVMGVIFGFVTFGKMFMDDLNVGKVIQAQKEENFADGLKYLTKTNDLNHKEGRYYTIGAQYSLFLANKGILENDKQTIQHINNAVNQAVKGVEMMPNDAFANEVAGFVYESGWKYLTSKDALNEARKYYKKASELEPKNPSFYISLGKIDLIEMQLVQAIDDEGVNLKKKLAESAKNYFEKAESKFNSENDKAPVYYYLATTNELLGNIDAAIENMEKAVELSKNGLITDDKSEYDSAMNQQINYGFNLARLLQIRGLNKENQNAQADNERAENLFRQILGVNGDEISTLLSLGLLYENTGRWDEANEEYNKVLNILPENSQARESIQKLIEDLNTKRGVSPVQDDGENSNGF